MSHQEPTPLGRPDAFASSNEPNPGLLNQSNPLTLLDAGTKLIPSPFSGELLYQGCCTLLSVLFENRVGQRGSSVASHSQEKDRQALPSQIPDLLSIDIHSLNPVRSLPFHAVDLALDVDQLEAVGLALATPDVLLVQGGAGGQQSRVAAEMIRQFAIRDQRTLLVALRPVGLDAVLEFLVGDTNLCIFRTVGPDEPIIGLPAALRRFTLAGWHEHYQQAMQRAQENYISRIAQLQQAEIRLAACQERLALIEKINQARLALGEADLLEIVRQEVIRDASTPGLSDQSLLRQLSALEQEHVLENTAALSSLESQQQLSKILRLQLTNLEQQLDSLRPQAEARQAVRWWSPLFWQGISQSNVLSRFANLREEATTIDCQLTQAKMTIDQLEAEIVSRRQVLTERREQIIQHEIDRRTKILELQQIERQKQFESDQQRLSYLESLLTSATQAVSPDNDPSLQLTLEQATAECILAREKMAGTREWLECLQQTQDRFTQTLCMNTNLLAMTLPELQTDPHFQSPVSKGNPVFDRIVVQDADQLTETEFHQLTKRTLSCILLGRLPMSFELPLHSQRRTVSPGGIRVSHLRPKYFTQLWQHLHGDPRLQPYSWQHRAGKLICRLQTISSDQERWIQVEGVADRPDIHLQILTAPHIAPQLVAVVFPPSMTVHQAKEYLFKELQELTIQSRMDYYRWRESQDCLEFNLIRDRNADVVSVELQTGVREQLTLCGTEESEPVDGPSPWQTCSLEFDRHKGWDRARAESWIAKHLRLRPLGRTIGLLDYQQMQPALRLWLQQVLGEETVGLGSQHLSLLPSAHFVTIPAQTTVPQPLKTSFSHASYSGKSASIAVQNRKRSSSAGAGLELDLEDSRRVDLIPAPLRSLLPANGLVNYLEAVAVVQAVEKILDSPIAFEENEQWQKASRIPGRHPFLAILAFSSAQVDLLKCLMKQHPKFVDWQSRIDVGVPATFQHRQCHTALVSLVRSHKQHAVTYASGPEELRLALTRASHCLVIFGDPGTLHRRSQWTGPLDHLDEIAARQERQLVQRLVTDLFRENSSPPLLRVHDGNFTGCY